jgi:hypothetical protein
MVKPNAAEGASESSPSAPPLATAADAPEISTFD